MKWCAVELERGGSPRRNGADDLFAKIHKCHKMSPQFRRTHQYLKYLSTEHASFHYRGCELLFDLLRTFQTCDKFCQANGSCARRFVQAYPEQGTQENKFVRTGVQRIGSCYTWSRPLGKELAKAIALMEKYHLYGTSLGQVPNLVFIVARGIRQDLRVY